jgi:hypothetical protein
MSEVDADSNFPAKSAQNPVAGSMSVMAIFQQLRRVTFSPSVSDEAEFLQLKAFEGCRLIG